MKKILSITLAIISLTAILHFSVSKHYCGGTIAGTKISFTGQQATCGMEDDETKLPMAGLSFTSHCCDNVVVVCGTTGNYFPSSTSVTTFFQHIFQKFFISSQQELYCIRPVSPAEASLSPPGDSLSTLVDLSSICVFRI